MRRRIGLISLVCGVFAVAVGAMAAYARGELIPGSGVVLDWFAARGLVHDSPGIGVESLSGPSVFTISEERVVLAISAIALVFAAAGMLAALIAEYRREKTLYLSAGYTCAALTLTFFKPLYFIIAMVAGITVAMVMRHGRANPDT